MYNIIYRKYVEVQFEIILYFPLEEEKERKNKITISCIHYIYTETYVHIFFFQNAVKIFLPLTL